MQYGCKKIISTKQNVHVNLIIFFYALDLIMQIWSVWYKTKFGSQNLATNFGVLFMEY